MTRRPNLPRACRVLLLEDEALIAMDLEQWLTELGWEVVGPFKRNGEALAALGRVSVDLAVLDYLLEDGTSGGVADRLDRMSVPYVFVTGCQQLMQQDRRHRVPILGKPIWRQRMAEALEAVRLNAAPCAHGG